ncbi:MAG: MarR family winged helix-turn-helix transcriptional regulator [Lentihominibacter sp.]|jgi:DNA-binding MarR family transcriptional regulator
MKHEYLPYFELLKMIKDSLEKQLNRELEAKDITFSQLQMLAILYRSPEGTAKLKELESQLDVAQSTAAGLAQRLEKRNWIVGYTDKNDRRIKNIRITDEGRALCMEAEAKIEEGGKRILSGFNGEEKGQFRYLLEKFYEAVK